MKGSKAFKQLEKEVFLLLYRDGILDMLLGFLLLFSATNLLLVNLDIDRPLILKVGIIPIAFILYLVKRYVTQSRLGIVEHSFTRKARTRKALYISFAAMGITLIVLAASIQGNITPEQKDQAFPLFIEFMFLVTFFVLIGHYTDNNSLMFFGLILAIGSPLAIYLEPILNYHFHGVIFLYVCGLIYCILGINSLITFLQDFPKYHLDKNERR